MELDDTTIEAIAARVRRLLSPTETDEQRDARFAPLNDRTWGEGNWLRCPICAPDSEGRQVYHHVNAHGPEPLPVPTATPTAWTMCEMCGGTGGRFDATFIEGGCTFCGGRGAIPSVPVPTATDSERPARGNEPPLPKSHSGHAHVKETGHRLALSSVAVSNCAECGWSSGEPLPVTSWVVGGCQARVLVTERAVRALATAAEERP